MLVSHRLQALEVFTWAQKVAVGGLAVSALAIAANVGAGQESPVAYAGLFGAAVTTGLAAWQLGKIRQKFIFVDYVQIQ